MNLENEGVPRTNTSNQTIEHILDIDPQTILSDKPAIPNLVRMVSYSNSPYLIVVVNPCYSSLVPEIDKVVNSLVKFYKQFTQDGKTRLDLSRTSKSQDGLRTYKVLNKSDRQLGTVRINPKAVKHTLSYSSKEADFAEVAHERITESFGIWFNPSSLNSNEHKSFYVTFMDPAGKITIHK